MYLQVIFNKLKNDLQNKDYYIQWFNDDPFYPSLHQLIVHIPRSDSNRELKSKEVFGRKSQVFYSTFFAKQTIC